MECSRACEPFFVSGWSRLLGGVEGVLGGTPTGLAFDRGPLRGPDCPPSETVGPLGRKLIFLFAPVAHLQPTIILGFGHASPCSFLAATPEGENGRCQEPIPPSGSSGATPRPSRTFFLLHLLEKVFCWPHPTGRANRSWTRSNTFRWGVWLADRGGEFCSPQPRRETSGILHTRASLREFCGACRCLCEAYPTPTGASGRVASARSGARSWSSPAITCIAGLVVQTRMPRRACMMPAFS